MTTVFVKEELLARQLVHTCDTARTHTQTHTVHWNTMHSVLYTMFIAHFNTKDRVLVKEELLASQLVHTY